MVTNTCLLTIESKKTPKYKNKQNSKRILDTESILMVARLEEVQRMSERGEGIEEGK